MLNGESFQPRARNTGPSRKGRQTTSTSADYFYTTSADSARLTRNFRLMLELVGLNGQVNFSGNRVVVAKVPTR